SRVKEVIPTDTGTSPVDTLVPLDTSEAIVNTPEKSSIPPPPTTTSTTTSSVIVPNRTIDVSNPEEDMSEPEVFSWQRLTPQYLKSLPQDTLLVDLLHSSRSSDLASTLRSNIQSMKDQISYRSKQLDADNKKVVKSTYELHFKFALAISCILFVLVGGAMGSIVRKGGFGYSLLISIVFFVIFIMMTILFRKTSEGGRLSPVLAAYLPVLVLLPIGLYLVYKAVNDSKLSLDFGRIRSWMLKLWERSKGFTPQTSEA